MKAFDQRQSGPETSSSLTRRLALGALLSVAGAAACTPAATGAGAAALPESEHPLRGEPAPGFSLPSRGGSEASLSSHAGKVVLLDFWATWCEPCRASFPEYQSLVSSYDGAVAIVGISEDDEDDGIDRFVEETGARFQVAWDGDKALAQQYKIESMPMLFIIDKNGLVRFVHSGFRAGDESRIRAAIDSLL